MPDYCWMQRGALNEDGDPVRIEIDPVCFRLKGHQGQHKSHPDAGHGEQITWDYSGYDRRVPEGLRVLFWTPPNDEVVA